MQRVDVVLLVDDEHRERGDDVEARHNEYEREEHVGEHLLYLHDAERVRLLLETVEHAELLACRCLYLALRRAEVGAWLQSELQGGEHTVLIEQLAGEVD